MAQSKTDFTVRAPFGTDIWKKPPHTNVYNAPTCHVSTLPFSTFASARITFSAPYVLQYDQGGLLLNFVPMSVRGTSGSKLPASSWIKAGVEFYNAAPRISFVGCDKWADWSVHDLHVATPTSATIEIIRKGDENGAALWAYELLLDQHGDVRDRIPLRECTWPCDPAEDKNVEVFAYAARPAKAQDGDAGSGLEVHFDKVEVLTR